MRTFRVSILASCLFAVSIGAFRSVPTLDAGSGDQPAKSSAVELLAKAIEERGLDAALAMFSELRKNPGDLTFNAQDFRALGNRLLERQKFEAAAAVFGLVVEMFPESPGAHFNLAKAHIYAGNKDSAEGNLRTLLSKNPEDFIAKRILEDLDGRLERAAWERRHFYKPGEQTGLKGPYFGQKPPGLTAEIFAPGVVSKALGHAFSCTFTPDGNEYYFNQFMTIMVCRRLEGGWTAPEPVPFTGNKRAHEPHVTLDGKRLYFGWFQPTPEGFPKAQEGYGDYGIYACERTPDGWGAPNYVGLGMFVTSSLDGQVYVTDITLKDSHIARATLENGVFVKYTPLGGGLADLPVRFSRTAHPCISPDGRTILFDAGEGEGLFAAYLDGSGNWSQPLSLSEHGLSAGAGIADYSPDGKFIFFSDKGDIYWISSEFAERLRPPARRRAGK